MSGDPPSGGASDEDAALAQRALDARERAYAPYSRYFVGAAARLGDAPHTGVNVENASYGLTICAERAAIAAAVAGGGRILEAMAVATSSSPPAPPCGMCLQTMLEFSPDPRATRVVLVNPSGERLRYALADLIPHGFGSSSLPEGS